MKGRKLPRLADIGFLVANSTQIIWMPVRASVRIDCDYLVADDASLSTDGCTVQPPRIHVAHIAGHKEGAGSMQYMQPLGIDVGPVRDI